MAYVCEWIRLEHCDYSSFLVAQEARELAKRDRVFWLVPSVTFVSLMVDGAFSGGSHHMGGKACS